MMGLNLFYSIRWCSRKNIVFWIFYHEIHKSLILKKFFECHCNCLKNLRIYLLSYKSTVHSRKEDPIIRGVISQHRVPNVTIQRLALIICCQIYPVAIARLNWLAQLKNSIKWKREWKLASEVLFFAALQKWFHDITNLDKNNWPEYNSHLHASHLENSSWNQKVSNSAKLILGVPK